MIVEHQATLDSPGVVPFSDGNLNITDPDRNMLFTIVCMKDQANDYVKVLKKNGYPAQIFDCDP